MKSLIFGYGITGQSFERYLIKKGKAFDIYDENLKGPNIYNQTLDPVILSKPKYSFGTGRRKGYQLSDAPGPGAYATDGFIGVLGKGSRRKTFGLTIDLDPHKKE